MLFSVITPSFRSVKWLKLCVASVADQGVPVEHIVQDAGSDDGTVEWLRQEPRVQAYVERDRGMYDAINRGLRRAQGDVLAYLNCDEQYLPGGLKRVADFFLAHPEIDVLFGDVVLIGPAGEYICHRKMQVPEKYHLWTCLLSTLSCGTFFRRRVIHEKGFMFDPGLRDVGDGEWMLRLLRAKIKMAPLNQFTSTFTQTGANMSTAPNAQRETRQIYATAPGWARKLRLLFILQHRLRRLLGGMYFQRPFAYDIYTSDSPNQRRRFQVNKPVGIWVWKKQ